MSRSRKKYLNELKRLHWVWFWSGNWPLLDCVLERDQSFEREFYKIAGIFPRVTVDFFKDGIVTAYHCQEEYERLGTFFLKKFEKNPSFIKDSLRGYKTRTGNDLRELTRFNHLKQINQVSHRGLAQIFRKVRRHFAYNSAMDHYAWYIEKFFVPLLQEFTTRRLSELGKGDLLPEYIFHLVTPSRQSRIFKERQDFFGILASIKGNKRLKALIQRSSTFSDIEALYPKLVTTIERHLKKYAWIPVLVNNPPTSKTDLWKEIIRYIRDDKTFKIESKRIGDNFDPAVLAKRKRMLDELAPNAAERALIIGLQCTAFIRTDDNAVMSKSSYLVMPLYNEIARRLGISYHALKQLTTVEVTDHLERGKKVSRALIRGRLKLTSYFVHNGRRIILTGSKAVIMRRAVEQQLARKGRRESVFKGTPASLGTVRGKVKVTLSSKDAHQIIPGSILVASATSADFVPAMRKAGAIVTEFGGITSHAAVVSREFGIPCIVGVRGITSQLHDGDKVEVNADEGVITVLKVK